MPFVDYTPECTQAIEQWDGTIGRPHKQFRRLTRIRVFQSALIEDYLATSHWLLPGLWFLPPIAACLWVSVAEGLGAATILGGMALGVMAWSLLEYSLHRWVFHLSPSAVFPSKELVFMMHGYHHEFPNDPLRLVAPPLMSWPVGGLIFLGYWLTLGVSGLPLFAGTAAGYLAYDWVHYYTHHAKPKTALGKYIVRYHLVHHYKETELNHGISSPLWDLVFGTYAWAASHPRWAKRQGR